ncbi:MAG: hypothetical protein GF418_10135, partial [Chitinivibrionales bacterium]|nr:hypothetical protein [Chitinivibrionales bacterium]MBD3395971.1 hypothetical protein [Chitinivibrionales bacterium]
MSKATILRGAMLVACTVWVGISYATFGLGVHYSLDFSVKMDAKEEQLTFDDLNLQTVGFVGAPAGWAGETFGPEDIPIYFDRGEMARTPFALGGKVYVDIIPIIDCIEIGGGFAAFEYDGKIRYPTSITVGAAAPATPDSLMNMIDQDLVTVEYDTLSTNIEDNASGVPGITKTPYAKLDMGLTIRKYIPLPVIDKVLKPYGGLGFDVMFTTPVISAGLVDDAVGADLTGDMSVAQVVAVMQDPATSQKIIDEIMARLFTPHFGMNIVLGFLLKPPVVPLGIYVDGKLAIPFGKLDEDAGVTG